MRNPNRQSGMAVVEFAIVAGLFFATVFAAIEMGRAYFVYNLLEESTRRGARLAAVCQIGDPDIQRIAVFGDGAGDSTVVNGLTTANMIITYHTESGVEVTTTLPVSDANFALIKLVRAEIDNFRHEMIIPFYYRIFDTPEFSTTLPRESLGVTRAGLQDC